MTQTRCRLALQYDPELADAENNLGLALAARNNWAEAVKHYRRAVELAPESARHHLNLGISLLALKSFEEGMEECKKAISLDADNIDAFAGSREVVSAFGQAARAFDEWKAILKHPDPQT